MSEHISEEQLKRAMLTIDRTIEQDRTLHADFIVACRVVMICSSATIGNELNMLRERVEQFDRERNTAQDMYKKLSTDHGELIAVAVKVYRLIAGAPNADIQKAYDILHAILAVQEIVCDTCAHKFTDEEACGLELDLRDPGEACPNWEIIG